MGPLAALYRVIFGSDTDPALRPILGINFAGSLAGSTVWSFVGIWAIKKLGADQSVLGLAYLVSALVGVGSGYLGGHLSDHVGRRPLILIGWIGQTAVVLGFVAAGTSATAGLLVLCFGGLFFQLGNAAGQALVADLVPHDRHEPAYAAVRVASNLGVTFGPPLGGLLLLLGSWNALFLGAAAFSAVGFVLAVLFLPARGAYAPEEPPSRGSFAVIARDRPFLLFLVSAAFAWLVYVAFETVLPISLVESHGYSSSTWGFLVVVNPLLVTFFQLRLTERVAAVPAAVKLAVGLPLMGLPFLLLSVNDALPVVMLILFLFVIGEMLWVPTSQTAVAGLAPPDLRGGLHGGVRGDGSNRLRARPFHRVAGAKELRGLCALDVAGRAVARCCGDRRGCGSDRARPQARRAGGCLGDRLVPLPVMPSACIAGWGTSPARTLGEMETISFARGVPAPELLPIEELADCAKTAIERDGAAALLYGHTLGYQPLREWVAERHGVDPARVVVTNGSLQAFHFVLSAFAGAGRVIVERPTYDRPRKILTGFDEVSLDDDGLDVHELERLLDVAERPAFLYTIPTFQNPAGVTLSEERRRRLAELASVRSLRILEDDPYGLVRFEGESLPTLFELEGGRNVMYSSSFSKTIAPGLRVGYVILPEEIAVGLEELVASTYITPALVTQATVLEFLRRGLLEPNLERVRGLLRLRRDAMLEALGRELGGRARWSRPEGGYFLWLEMPEDTDATELLGRATAAGVTFVPGSDFGGEPSSARLAFSFASPAEIDEGISRLGALVSAAAAVHLP